MKKNIIIGVLVVANFLAFVFAFIQKQSADMHQSDAIRAHDIAREQTKVAEQALANATKQMQLAEYQSIIVKQEAEKAKELAAK